MTNLELSEAIEQAHWLVQHTAHMQPNHPDLVTHLRELLQEQERRAKERQS